MSKIKKVILCCLSIPLIIISMCPTFAYAVQPDLTFSAGFSEPYVSDNSFYIEVLMQSVADPSVFNVHVYSVQYNVSYDTQPSTSIDIYQIVFPQLLYVNKDKYVLSFERNPNHLIVGEFFLTDYSVNYNTVTYNRAVSFDNSNSQIVTTFQTSDNWKVVSVNSKGISVQAPGTSIVTQDFTFLVNYSNSNDTFAKIQEIINQLYVLHQDNIDQVDKLVEIINGVIQLHSDNLEILEEFATLLSDTAYIKDVLDQIIIYLSEDQVYLLWELDYELIGVNEKLDLIIQILQSSGESNLTSPDSSNVDDYYEIEQGLINRTDVDVSNVVNVQIDQNAMSFTWNLLDTIMNSNGKVFGMTLTVLSLGIIALILGR